MKKHKPATPKPSKVVFADNVKRLRLDAGWSQTVLAKKAGIEQTAVSKIETAKHDPQAKTIGKIAVALGVRLVELLAD